jgi:hypothetical protein
MGNAFKVNNALIDRGAYRLEKFTIHKKQIISFGLLLVFLLAFAHDETISIFALFEFDELKQRAPGGTR